MKKFNIGLFVGDIDGNKEVIRKIYNDIVENSNDVVDFSVFFERIGKIDSDVKCGFFNASNLTDFHGYLLCYNLDALRMAQSVVNNIKLYCLCDKLDVLTYFNLEAKNPNVVYIVFDELQKKNFHRVTGKEVAIYDKNIIQIIKEISHE